MDQHQTPVTAIQMEVGMTEVIGQMMITLEWGQRPIPVTAIQMAADFD
jgi:hypothetical protein